MNQSLVIVGRYLLYFLFRVGVYSYILGIFSLVWTVGVAFAAQAWCGSVVLVSGACTHGCWDIHSSKFQNSKKNAAKKKLLPCHMDISVKKFRSKFSCATPEPCGTLFRWIVPGLCPNGFVGSAILLYVAEDLQMFVCPCIVYGVDGCNKGDLQDFVT